MHTRYSPALAARVCAHIAEGRSLASFQHQSGAPSRSTLQRWIDVHPEFQRMYQDACAQRAEGARLRGESDPGHGGRPSVYSPELAELICARMAEGESLRGIVRRPGMPSAASVQLWLHEREDFRALYALAAEHRAESLADEALEIADDALADAAEPRDRLSWARLRIDTRKWRVAIMTPKVFGRPPKDDRTPYTYDDFILELERQDLLQAAIGGRD